MEEPVKEKSEGGISVDPRQRAKALASEFLPSRALVNAFKSVSSAPFTTSATESLAPTTISGRERRENGEPTLDDGASRPRDVTSA